ncbi:hypothetical protein TRIUR3_03904 [Triticum urartu]|uniref:Uncharacterized protein n=1 Tax=Triticum urartu TaxID=4572 RepID=M7ZKQ0_TRIUA|nr:hypothetical protein TRIUR3_03904 [Triticum urartu]
MQLVKQLNQDCLNDVPKISIELCGKAIRTRSLVVFHLKHRGSNFLLRERGDRGLTSTILSRESIKAWSLWREGKAGKLVDPSMAGSCSQDEALLCIHVGLLCVEDDPSRRPLMSSVVSILENGSASSLSLPTPVQPAFIEMMGDKSQRSDLENTRNTMAMTVLQGR